MDGGTTSVLRKPSSFDSPAMAYIVPMKLNLDTREAHYCRMLLTRHYNQRPFDETVCDALITNGDVKNPSKKMQNVCDGGYIKHGSDFSYVCDVGHTVQFNELFAKRRKNRNGQPDEGVCDVWHTVHSDELFALSQENRNGSI